MLLKRTLTALVLAPLAIALILLASDAVFAAVVALAFLVALWEWARLAGITGPVGRTLWLVAGAAAFALVWVFRATPLPAVLLAAGLAWWLLSLLWLRHFAWAAAPTPGHRGVKLLAGGCVILPAFAALLLLHGREDGPWWTLVALFTVWASDIGAYFSGRAFGRRKLAPQISPGKTWAGAWGALLAGTTLAALGSWLLTDADARLFALALLGTLTVAASIVGDLFESLMKRHAQVKDSGTIFPGHGGMLDRLDSVFAALPVFTAGLLLLDP